MPTYWIAAIVVFFVYLLPMFYLLRNAADMNMQKNEEMAWTVAMAIITSLGLALFWPLTLVGTVLFFVVRWLESVRVK